MVIFDILIDIVGYTAARLILPRLSFGRMCVEPPTSGHRRFNALGCRRDESGRIEMEQTVAGWIGVVTCFAALLAVILLIEAVA
ncbi:hypothetical protein [Bradyrhizobium lablabi]|uniref:hypothetical protein n=1 Tax=Bradyrhizobium lablabi TaxID=722472 RepID=UPI001BA997E7|nr:hypothetical protein [Bradyrhizobium lablabi]MBR0694818.1 hypothetical protein [Bradyrhizobium lablabi]